MKIPKEFKITKEERELLKSNSVDYKAIPKKIRHTIYKEVLKRLEVNAIYGLCTLVEIAAREKKVHDWWTIDDHYSSSKFRAGRGLLSKVRARRYPELMLVPKSITQMYWFCDVRERIAFLEKAIKLTE